MPAYVAIVSYADLAYANSYMADRFDTGKWDSADDPTKQKALNMATIWIDRMPLIGWKTKPDYGTTILQPRQFPRMGDANVEPEVIDACCEIALALLNGNSITEMVKDVGKASESIGDASTSYEQGGALKLLDLWYGFPCEEAAVLMAGWLKDDGQITLVRT